MCRDEDKFIFSIIAYKYLLSINTTLYRNTRNTREKRGFQGCQILNLVVYKIYLLLIH